MAIYLNMQEHPDAIKGNATAAGYDGWIELQSINWGCMRPQNMEAGATKDRESSIVSCSELSASLNTDSASPQLMVAACVGAAGPAEIHIVQTGENQEPYLKFKLENAIVSSYQISGHKDGNPDENISMAFTKIEMEHQKYKEDMTPETPTRGGFDLSTATKV